MSKVWANYNESKNLFEIKVNDEDYYSLVPEEVAFDPSKTEPITFNYRINNRIVHNGTMSWVIDMLDEKISNNITDEVQTIEI